MLKVKVDNDFEFPASWEVFLFNEREQWKQQSDGFKSFVLLNAEVVSARITFIIQNNVAYSPFRAPFGSVEFRKDLSVASLQFFLNKVETELSALGVKKIRITSWPDCYDQASASKLTKAYLDSAYKVVFREMNFHLPVNGEFKDHVHPSLSRRLIKSANLYSVDINGNPDLKEIFLLIRQNREMKGLPLTINLPALENLYRNFQDKFLVFEGRRDSRLVAVSFGIIVNKNILYYFLPADDYAFKHDSPMLLVLEKMYEYCRENNFKIFDLGIATSKEFPNWGLINFKRRLGGKESLKLSFGKEIDMIYRNVFL
ncbi:MAG: GNAT family N-acetyltransferase [Cytophagaceae bacterium]